MSFYEDRILPHLINLAMCSRHFVAHREHTRSAAKGRVLEIGICFGRLQAAGR